MSSYDEDRAADGAVKEREAIVLFIRRSARARVRSLEAQEALLAAAIEINRGHHHDPKLKHGRGK